MAEVSIQTLNKVPDIGCSPSILQPLLTAEPLAVNIASKEQAIYPGSNIQMCFIEVSTRLAEAQGYSPTQQ